MSEPVTQTDRPMTDPRTLTDRDDVRGKRTTSDDRSSHRRHAWLYEDLLA